MMASAHDLGPKPAVLVGLLMLDGLKLGEVLEADFDDLGGPPPTLSRESSRSPAAHRSARDHRRPRSTRARMA